VYTRPSKDNLRHRRMNRFDKIASKVCDVRELRMFHSNNVRGYNGFSNEAISIYPSGE